MLLVRVPLAVVLGLLLYGLAAAVLHLMEGA
jgi:hypothetical protein